MGVGPNAGHSCGLVNFLLFDASFSLALTFFHTFYYYFILFDFFFLFFDRQIEYILLLLTRNPSQLFFNFICVHMNAFLFAYTEIESVLVLCRKEDLFSILLGRKVFVLK